MNRLVNFLIFIIIGTNLYSQTNWINKSYGVLSYKIPDDWIESEYIENDNNKSYGAMFFGPGKAAQFSVIETPNDSDLRDAHDLTNNDIKNVVLNIFSQNATFIGFKNQKIDNINAKYCKAIATVQGNSQISSVNYLIFINNKMVIIQGIYSTNNEVELLPILTTIIKGINFKY